MPRVLIEPLPATAWVLPVEPPEFVREFASTMGDAATERDGFDSAFAAAASGLANMRHFAPLLDQDLAAEARARQGVVADLDSPLAREHTTLDAQGSADLDRLLGYIQGTQPVVDNPTPVALGPVSTGYPVPAGCRTSRCRTQPPPLAG